MIRIIIYEDKNDLRNALAGLIGGTSEMLLVGAFDHCKNVASEVAILHPNVVIMDIGLPEMSGIEGLKIIKSINPEIEVMMFTVFDDDDRIFEALQGGASGYILKNANPGKIIDSIKDIMTGGAPISPTVAKKILDSLPSSHTKIAKPAESTLSDRETEILNLLAKGYSQKMVSEQLNISINTVRTLIRRCYQKLQVHSITEAVAKVFMNNKDK